VLTPGFSPISFPTHPSSIHTAKKSKKSQNKRKFILVFPIKEAYIRPERQKNIDSFSFFKSISGIHERLPQTKGV
jgi:hypothetical protein